MKILLIDNYDSFTYNLYHLIQSKVSDIDVIRNDKIELKKINKYDKILLSPGPGLPSENGQMKQLIKKYCKEKSILGICLGHQAIGEVFNCKLLKMDNVKHGSSSFLSNFDETDYLFSGIKKPIEVGHYHSWHLDKNFISKSINIIAESNNIVMAISHKEFDIRGLQFHPESILTPKGGKIINNWLKY